MDVEKSNLVPLCSSTLSNQGRIFFSLELGDGEYSHDFPNFFSDTADFSEEGSMHQHTHDQNRRLLSFHVFWFCVSVWYEFWAHQHPTTSCDFLSSEDVQVNLASKIASKMETRLWILGCLLAHVLEGKSFKSPNLQKPF